VTGYRWIRKIGFLEIALIFWIMTCMYLWVVSSENLRGYVMRKFPSRVVSVIETTRERIWPYIWRQYIYAE
jgi:hypothetical protein